MLQNKIITEIKALADKKDFVLAAIDGRCGAGKTTLAEKISKELSCNVIHLDHFFLRPEQRTAKRLETPGGNVDYERFLREVLIPLKENRTFSYRPYICNKQDFGDPIEISANKITIIEGSYSCHPKLWDFYDLHIFLDIESEEQLRRITERNGKEAAGNFKNLWIPLEEKYFNEYRIKEHCEIK